MRGGYIGQKSRKRKFYRLLILFIILLFGSIIFFVNTNINIDEEVIEINIQTPQIEDSNAIEKLETRILEKEQNLQLRDNIISSLKNQIKVLKKSNEEFIKSIEKIYIDNENIDL